MFYFVCEGRKNKSEYNFVKRLVELYNYNNLSYTIISTDGNKNIKRVLNDIIMQCQSNDTIILFFDNIEEINGISTYDLLLTYTNICNSHNIYFRYTLYYCFEELFLTYSRLSNLVNSDVYKYFIDLVQKCIMSGKNYIDYLSLNDIKILNNLLSLDVEKTTREAVSASLLGVVTKKYFRSFSYYKV